MRRAKHRLANLTVLIDYNKIQSAGTDRRNLRTLEPLADKWRAFGFGVAEVDGHDVVALRARVARLPLDGDRPSARSSANGKGQGAILSPSTTPTGTTNRP